MTCRTGVGERCEGTGVGNSRTKKEANIDLHELLLQDFVTNVDIKLIKPIDNLHVMCTDLVILVELETENVEHSNEDVVVLTSPLKKVFGSLLNYPYKQPVVHHSCNCVSEVDGLFQVQYWILLFLATTKINGALGARCN